MAYRPENPLMIQSDMSVLLEVNHPDYAVVRDALSAFAELEKSPDHIHTYRITPLSLWNAASAGMELERIMAVIERYSKFDTAPNVLREIEDVYRKFELLQLEREGDELLLSSSDPSLLQELLRYSSLQSLLLGRAGTGAVRVAPQQRGAMKRELMKLGYPVRDLAGYTAGTPLALDFRQTTLGGRAFVLRDYQRQAADSFYAEGSAYGGSGVLALPCGAGKTVIGMAAAISVQAEVLVLTSSVTAARQWIGEFLDKTTLAPEQIGEYSGDAKVIRPVTVATYQIVSHRKDREDEFAHLALFGERDWGLIIYDEVHLLPAPVFRITADIQARRRLGLTATLVREDGLEADVFALIGPKKYDVPWKELERAGWIATALCTEVRVRLSGAERMTYAEADARAQARIASEASAKLTVALELVRAHPGEGVLVIGQYLDQLERVAAALQAPIITGKTPTRERDALYASFREGQVRVLVVSKVANFAIDLPDASVAIQLSGQFGSRQEEAQRLGRILRPKADGVQARFYSLVTRDTKDQQFALNRQRFLTEQGYQYTIVDADEIVPGVSETEPLLPQSQGAGERAHGQNAPSRSDRKTAPSAATAGKVLDMEAFRSGRTGRSDLR
ncbi:DNA repair helicase XPB [Cohnella sp. 56]|uniref:DNA repair helicase XPB n=1 Tax=Cohnella sp. 56 TaxID=3113722 RepID=UPI0030E85C79